MVCPEINIVYFGLRRTFVWVQWQTARAQPCLQMASGIEPKLQLALSGKLLACNPASKFCKNPQLMLCSELSRGCSCKLLTRNLALIILQKSNKMTGCSQWQTHYAQALNMLQKSNENDRLLSSPRQKFMNKSSFENS